MSRRPDFLGGEREEDGVERSYRALSSLSWQIWKEINKGNWFPFYVLIHDTCTPKPNTHTIESLKLSTRYLRINMKTRVVRPYDMMHAYFLLCFVCRKKRGIFTSRLTYAQKKKKQKGFPAPRKKGGQPANTQPRSNPSQKEKKKHKKKPTTTYPI